MQGAPRGSTRGGGLVAAVPRNGGIGTVAAAGSGGGGGGGVAADGGATATALEPQQPWWGSSGSVGAAAATVAVVRGGGTQAKVWGEPGDITRVPQSQASGVGRSQKRRPSDCDAVECPRVTTPLSACRWGRPSLKGDAGG
jgi:hypothetical protein